jgi:hypothetical protein
LTVGLGAGSVATNTAIGVSALAANTTGANNTSVGYQAMDVAHQILKKMSLHEDSHNTNND